MSVVDLIKAETRRQCRPLMVAAGASAAVAFASVTLLGLSGWFIVGAAMAGVGGTVAAFNYLLPSAAVRALAIIRTVSRYGERLEGHRAALRALSRVRPAIFAGLAAQQPSTELRLSVGEANARLTQDVDAVETLFIRRSATIGAGVSLLTGLVLSSLAGWPCAAALAALFALQVGVSMVLADLLTRQAGADLQRGAGQLKDAAAARLAAAPELAAYHITDIASEQVVQASKALIETRTRLHRAEGWQAAFNATMIGLATIAVALLARGASPPMMALAALVAGVAMEGAAVLARGFQQDGAAREAIRRIDAALKVDAGPPLQPVSSHQLAFRTCENAWITVRPGERLAVLGPSGCGKTTLVERMLKLRPSVADALRVGDCDIEQLQTGSVRALFAYAPQDTSVLSGTVRDNLALAAPDAGDDAIWAALHDAALDERILQMPAGLETWLGDAGERLSGGERRRLCLARALLRTAPWLVLDEPTEGLDHDTEARVVRRLALRLDATRQGLILISHRPAPLALCSRALTLAPETIRTDQAA